MAEPAKGEEAFQMSEGGKGAVWVGRKPYNMRSCGGFTNNQPRNQKGSRQACKILVDFFFIIQRDFGTMTQDKKYLWKLQEAILTMLQHQGTIIY